MDLNKGSRLWRQCCKRRSIRTTFTTQQASVVGGVAGSYRGTGDWRMAGCVRVGDTGIRRKVEGGDGVPSFRGSQTHGGSHGGSRLPLEGGVQVLYDARSFRSILRHDLPLSVEEARELEIGHDHWSRSRQFCLVIALIDRSPRILNLRLYSRSTLTLTLTLLFV